MKCLLCVPRVSGISSRIAFRPQLPLGHVMVGSNLLRGGHEVGLLDADVRGLSHRETVDAIARLQPECLLVGHPASTVAHPAAMRLMAAVRERLPESKIIYGGLHPTYHAHEILDSGNVDFVVTHEAEFVTRSLVDRLATTPHTARETPGVLSHGRRTTIAAATSKDLDSVRPLWDGPWELHRYRAFAKPSAVVQFSRGCPRKCSYCGQWDFWKSWRHRSVDSFVGDVASLSQRGVRVFWIADENWSIDRALFLELLRGLRSVNQNHHLIVAMEAGHVVRDLADHGLYRDAGISQIMLGLDGEDDALLGKNPKQVNDEQLSAAIRSLRASGISTIVNHFMPAVGSAAPPDFGRLRTIQADFYNTLHPTPHRWTAYGSRSADQIFTHDLQKWDYRHPVIGRTEFEMLKKRWRAKEVEFRLNTEGLSHGLRHAIQSGRAAHLAPISVFLAGMVFVRELIVLARDTLIAVLRYPCPEQRKIRHAHRSIRRRLPILGGT